MDITEGMCLLSATAGDQSTQLSIVLRTEVLSDRGLYTAVAMNEYIVVNGIVASPFAHSHFLANAYYNLYRTSCSLGYCIGAGTQDWLRSFHQFILNTVMSLKSLNPFS